MINAQSDLLLTLPSDQDASGRDLGAEELELLARAVGSGTLTSTKGRFVPDFENAFARMLGVDKAYACASGTGAIHTAIAALDPEPGDEIITSPITDMGALSPILYQGAIPVFADVDPRTCNVTAQTIEARMSDRTRAIVVTHLFGNPCDMDPILQLAASRGIPIIEDCAQAFLASCGGRYVGTMGTIGAFSMQQGKHMTCGEGGAVVTGDPQLARRMYLFINKAWGYGDPSPDHYFLALNYRMSELQGAVARAQLDKLDRAVRRRIAVANLLTSRLQSTEGIGVPFVHPNCVHTYWKYALRVDSSRVKGGAVALAAALKPKGIFAVPRYIQKPAFMCEVFQKQATFGKSRFPFTLARPQAIDYRRELFPGAFDALEGILVVPLNERYTDEHAAYVAESIGNAVEQLRG